MLKPPYTRYEERLYLYTLKLAELPPLADPDLIGAWVEDGEAVLFFHRQKKEFVEALCRKTGSSLVYEADLDYRDWEAGHAIHPFELAGLKVAPVWEAASADICLDPSVIFGTGFHPTTRMCLETLLQNLASGHRIDTMLDLGSGTGLLAIAAAQKGIHRVTAVDHNSLACALAAANAERNGVADRIEVRQLDLRRDCPDTRVDLVIANLYRSLLEHLFQNPSFWQANHYLLSGFVPAMEAELLASLPPRGLTFVQRRREELWCLWELKRSLT
jgi:ribosomal protein L11 methyltransferase